MNAGMVKELEKDISRCMLRDQHRFRKAVKGAGDAKIAELSRQIQQSVAECQSRLDSIPMITFPESLPVSGKRDEIARAIRDNQVVVIAGETGSGKTTQIPKICLSLGLGAKGLIGHTQPRRLAARAVAERIAEELGQPLGLSVGYQVRFEDNSSAGTLIKLMTDGILLAEIQQDRYLSKYEVIIIDEAHERSLNIDFLLGYLKRLCRQRPDLKIIVTSATIDVEKFSRHFDDAPIVSVSGRTYPVEILYQDPAELELADDQDLLEGAVLKALDTIEQMERQQRQLPGDILVFLSGEREIRDLALALRKRQLRQTEILPLYARLTRNEQQKIFQSHVGRRIVLSTNVAETSLTVPGIRYVIDSGLARISRYSIQSKVQRLPIEPISQASANQRAGRCGRVENGVCIRLYTENDFMSRPTFTDPEIHRTNLSAVILQMLLLRLGEIQQFPFVEPPESRAINDGFKLLAELGAIGRERQLTDIGRKMARLPVDPRLARMLIEADKRQCLYEMLLVTSALSVQDPRETPADKRQSAREAHQQHAHPESDFMFWVQLWGQVEQNRQDLSQSQFRRYCLDNFLSWMRLREWRETHRQLALSCQQYGMKAAKNSSDISRSLYEAVHRCVITGSLNQIGFKSNDGLYTGSRGRKFSLFPTSTLFRKTPRWIVCGELIETSRLYATMAARIEPEWVVDAATDLLKREYFDAHWEKKRGEVIAWEKISLAGLVLIEKRAVPFAQIDPTLCRDIFIREALVEGELGSNFEFFKHNMDLLAEVQRLEEKERKPDILVADDVLYSWYESRLPTDVLSVSSLRRWYNSCVKQEPHLLKMSMSDVVSRKPDESLHQFFPDQATLGRNTLAINYRFAPGSDEDGVSIDVPVSLLGSITAVDLEWVVPGLVYDRCVAMVKGLPKSIRKMLVPVPEFVKAALDFLPAGEKPPLSSLLSEFAWRQQRIKIDPAHWDYSVLPAHTRPRLRVVDNEGSELVQGDNIEALITAVSGSVQSPVLPSHTIEQGNLTDWTFGDLPEHIEIQQGITLLRYPAIKNDLKSVSIILCDSENAARLISQDGIARLYMFRTAQQHQLILKRLNEIRKTLGLKLSVEESDWQERALLAIYRLNFELNERLPWSREAFENTLLRYKAELVATAERMCKLLLETYNEVYDIRRTLSLRKQGSTLPDSVVADVEQQLQSLMPAGFPAVIPDDWIWEYGRYLKALRLRLEKPIQERDLGLMADLARLTQAYEQLKQLKGEIIPEFPWLLQELRVSLFAQSLRTRQVVSVKRLERMLEVARMGDIQRGSNLG